MDEALNLSLESVKLKPADIPNTRSLLNSEPFYFIDTAEDLIKNYQSQTLIVGTIVNDIPHSIFNIAALKVYNCIYFLSAYSNGKCKLEYDRCENLIFNYSSFKKWHDILLRDLKEKDLCSLYFSD